MLSPRAISWIAASPKSFPFLPLPSPSLSWLPILGGTEHGRVAAVLALVDTARGMCLGVGQGKEGFWLWGRDRGVSLSLGQERGVSLFFGAGTGVSLVFWGRYRRFFLALGLCPAS